MSGLEVCRRIKSDPDTSAVLVLHVSATATAGADRLQALEYGADTYLIEPVETEELIATVRALLRLRAAETALRERERQFQAILDHTPVVLFMKDAGGRYLLANREYEQLTGRSVADLKGRLDVELFDRTAARALGAHEQEVMETRQATEFEAPLGLGPPDRVYHQIKFPVYDSAQQPYAVCTIATDITQRKRADLEYQALLAREQDARRDAENANRTKDDFLATLSHELRTPHRRHPRVGPGAHHRPARRGDPPSRAREHRAERAPAGPADRRPPGPLAHHRGQAAARPARGRSGSRADRRHRDRAPRGPGEGDPDRQLPRDRHGHRHGRLRGASSRCSGTSCRTR